MNDNIDSFKEELLQIIRQMVDNQRTFEEKLTQLFLNDTAMDCAIDNLKYEVFDEIRNKSDTILIPQIEPIDVTIENIIQGKSMCRFGDGEFEIMSGKERQKFQQPTPKLQKHLIEVFNSEEDDIIIGIADNYGSLAKYNSDGKYNIRVYLTEQVRKEHYKFIDMNRVYANAYITRPYAMYADNYTDAPKKRFDAIKKIWEDKEILIIEGEKTRMGIGNNLFDKAKSITRIICPAISAYDRYDEILEKAKEQDKNKLVLIALGPAATVLAYDLAKAGYQALDIGHIDIEYDWMIAGKGEKIDIPHKYVNEIHGGDNVSDIKDENYEIQIIARIL